MAPGSVLFDQSIPRLELYFLLGIVYSVMTPTILPFIILFFGFGYLAYRNQIINVYDASYDSAAAFWPHVHARIIAAMIIEQLTLIGVFTIKGPIGFVKVSNNDTDVRYKALRYLRDIFSSTPFMILLPVCTLVFHFYCTRRFHPVFHNYPLEDAAAKDRQEKKDSPDLDLKDYLNKAYLNPALKTEEEHYLQEKETNEVGGGHSPTNDIERGSHQELLEEEDDQFRRSFSPPSEEFEDALSRYPGSESDNSFAGSASSPRLNH